MDAWKSEFKKGLLLNEQEDVMNGLSVAFRRANLSRRYSYQS